MTAAYPDAIITEFYNGTAWINLSAYVVGDINGSNGLGGWKPDARVAILGTLTLALNNKAKLFSPMGGDFVRGLNTLSGFTKGAKIRVRVEVSGQSFTIWAGRILSLDSDDKNWGNEQTRLTAADWMDIPANYPMKRATIATNQTMNAALALILARLAVQPEAIDFDTGTFTFPAVFDNVRNKTMAAGELTKLANSELGYIYLKQDGTLRAENANARGGTRRLDTTLSYAEVELLDEGSNLLQDEAGNQLIEDSIPTAAALATDAESFNILMDPSMILNSAIVRAYPTVTDTSLKVLYSLGTPMKIAAGATVVFSAHYTDPNGLSQVSGTNMQAPVATTDYLANTKSDCTGTNKTANMTVSAVYSGDTVTYTITNGANKNVFMTFLQARGYGIYYGNSIESIVDDAASQAAYGLAAFQFDQRYQKDPYAGAAYSAAVINQYKTPKSRITKMKYLANLNGAHLMAFLTLSIGSLMMLTEDRSAISNHYYITDRAFTAKPGGIIYASYGLKQQDSYLSGALRPITAEFAGAGAVDAINYGYLPRVSNLANRTLSAWIYLNQFDPFGAVVGIYSDDAAFLMRIPSATTQVTLTIKTANQIEYDSPIGSMTTGAWHHIAVSRSNVIDTVLPRIYIDGVEQVVTTGSGPAGDLPNDETSAEFIIGNVHTATINYSWGLDGKIFDARVYDRILSQAEITALYNGGTPNSALVPDGVVFQGPAISGDYGTPSSGVLVSAYSPILDNAFRAVATVNGVPLIRDNP